MKAAILGFGSMGSMLGRILAEQGPADLALAAADRRPERFAAARGWPRFEPGCDFAAAARGAGVVLLCVPPLACRELLELVGADLDPGALLVSIAADLPLRALATRHAGPLCRIMPTVNAEIGQGVTLLAAAPEHIGPARAALEGIFGGRLGLRPVPEPFFETGSLATSCGPGIYATLLACFRDALAGPDAPDAAELAALVRDSVEAFCRLSRETGQDFEAVYARVATKGGVTEQAAGALREGLPALFADMRGRAAERHARRGAQVLADFGLDG